MSKSGEDIIYVSWVGYRPEGETETTVWGWGFASPLKTSADLLKLRQTIVDENGLRDVVLTGIFPLKSAEDT